MDVDVRSAGFVLETDTGTRCRSLGMFLVAEALHQRQGFFVGEVLRQSAESLYQFFFSSHLCFFSAKVLILVLFRKLFTNYFPIFLPPKDYTHQRQSVEGLNTTPVEGLNGEVLKGLILLR